MSSTPPPVWLQYASIFIAFSSLFVSGLTLLLQRRDKRPRLKTVEEIHQDSIHDGQRKRLCSYRVANSGSVSIQLLDLRLVLSQTYEDKHINNLLVGLARRWLKDVRRRLLPYREERLPRIQKADWANLREGEVGLPHIIEPGGRVRLSVLAAEMDQMLSNAGFDGRTRYKVAVVSASGKRYMTRGIVSVSSDRPRLPADP